MAGASYAFGHKAADQSLHNPCLYADCKKTAFIGRAHRRYAANRCACHDLGLYGQPRQCQCYDRLHKRGPVGDYPKHTVLHNSLFLLSQSIIYLDNLSRIIRRLDRRSICPSKVFGLICHPLDFVKRMPPRCLKQAKDATQMT